MSFDLTRRSLLKKTGVIALGALALPAWMPRIAFAAKDSAPKGDTLVCIFQRGGMDGLNAVVPHGEKAYYAARDSLAVPQPRVGDAKAAIDLDGFFGLNPNLGPFKEIFDAKRLAIVHAAGSPDPSHSHFDAMDFMERGTPGEKSIPTGWLARHLQSAASQNKSPFRAVGMGAMLQSSLRGPVPATALQSIAQFHLNGNAQEIAKFQTSLASLYLGDNFLDVEGTQTIDAIEMLARATAGAYTPANGAKYPESNYGKALQAVAQLIKSDLGVEIACVDLGGWDTHAGEGAVDGGELPRLLAEFSQGIHAFYMDMGDRMSGITLVSMSEFGRRLLENNSHGTDHGHGNVMFVLGGGIQGGKVYGDWPGLEKNQLYGPGDLNVTTDFRDILGEIVKNRLGNANLAAVFPNYRDFKFRNLTAPLTAQNSLAPRQAVALRGIAVPALGGGS
jgi:uncharacterized protein (DUF1501 family)